MIHLYLIVVKIVIKLNKNCLFTITQN